MSGTCGSVTESRKRSYGEDEPSCDPAPEDPGAARLRESREAEQRQDAWATGDSRGGMSRGNASTISSTPQRCDGPTEDETARETFLRNVRERNAKLAEHTAKVDTPLQSDPIGNALPGLVGGAVVGGVAAAAGGGIRHIAGHIAEHAAKDIAAELVEHGAHHVVHELTPHGHKISEAHEDAMPFGPPPPPAAKSNNRAEPAKAPAAGRTGAAGTCEPAERPGECNSEPPIGQDRMPYAPGRAPLRIPEAPREETVERPVMVAG